MKNQIQMTEDLAFQYCEICDNFTPVVEVEMVDHAREFSWSEEQCAYCSENSSVW